MNGKILIVDDDRSTCELLQRHLEDRGFVVKSNTSSEEAFAALSSEDFDLVLTDLNMAKLNGIELCDRVVSNYPNIPVIVITAFGSLETAVEAIRVGAYDFITKPFDLNALAHSVERAIKHSTILESVKKLSSPHGDPRFGDEIVGESASVVELRSLLTRSSHSNVPVLIIGESGSGKELAAASLHSRSPRRNRPFLVLNCATISEQTAYADLFGPFGVFLRANGGTVLLKEIVQLPAQIQRDLERMLAEGSLATANNQALAVDVRVVASGTSSLQEAVASGVFRKALFERINVVRIAVSPLRERENDALALAQNFVRQFSRRHEKNVLGISSGVAAKLLQYAWPGNVRELRNAIERAVALTSHERLVVEDLPDNIRRYRQSESLHGKVDEQFLPMEEIERKHILRVLDSSGGNKLLAAKILGLDRRTLYRKLEQYEV